MGDEGEGVRKKMSDIIYRQPPRLKFIVITIDKYQIQTLKTKI